MTGMNVCICLLFGVYVNEKINEWKNRFSSQMVISVSIHHTFILDSKKYDSAELIYTI